MEVEEINQMSFTRAQIQKYFDRQKGLIIFWVALLLAYGGYGIFLASPSAANVDVQVIAPTILQTLVFLQLLLAWILIPFIVHEDPAVGTTSFWLTRPISGQRLLWINTKFIFTLFIFLPLIIELSILASHQLLPSGWLLPIGKLLLAKLNFVVVIYLLAVLTRRFSQYALLTFLTIVLFIVTLAIHIFVNKPTTISLPEFTSQTFLIFLIWIFIVRKYTLRDIKIYEGSLIFLIVLWVLSGVIDKFINSYWAASDMPNNFKEERCSLQQVPMQEAIVSEGNYLVKQHAKQKIIRMPMPLRQEAAE